MTTSKSKSSLVLFPESLIEFRKWDIKFTENDIQEFIEYRDVLVKFIDLQIHTYQANLWNLRYKVDEIGTIYLYIDGLRALKTSIDNTFVNYKKHIKDKETK